MNGGQAGEAYGDPVLVIELLDGGAGGRDFAFDYGGGLLRQILVGAERIEASRDFRGFFHRHGGRGRRVHVGEDIRQPFSVGAGEQAMHAIHGESDPGGARLIAGLA